MDNSKMDIKLTPELLGLDDIEITEVKLTSNNKVRGNHSALLIN